MASSTRARNSRNTAAASVAQLRLKLSDAQAGGVGRNWSFSHVRSINTDDHADLEATSSVSNPLAEICRFAVSESLYLVLCGSFAGLGPVPL